jgi:actin-related protein 6
MPTSETPAKAPPKKQPAKRKRSTSATSRKKKVAAPAEPAKRVILPPTRTLIIDNGGDTVKYGWSTDDQPRKMPNVSARLIHQFTVLVGDEMEQVQNPNSLIGITRSTERGMISNLGNQTQVWKRILDTLGVTIPPNSEAATSFGWKVGGGRTMAGGPDPAEPNIIPSHSIAVVLLLPPLCPRILLDQIFYVWMEDFGVSHVGIGISSVLASKEHPTWKTSCTVDLGWSSCLVVPTFKKKPIEPSTAIRRLPIGGRHLINMLKYFMSYRQYNLMDQDHILRDLLEQQGYFSLDFEKDLQLARQLPSGRRPYDRDYVLPDYQTTHKGTVRLTPQLQKELQKEGKKEVDDEDDDDDDDDEDFEAGDEESGDDSGNDEDQQRSDGGEDGDDDGEETDEQKRARLVRERGEEQRRRREREEEEQMLRISVERFTVPEVLFRPKDAGLQADLVGIGQTIIQSIMASPKFYHAALFQTICITGGLSKLPNLQVRLERELRPLVPAEFTLKIERLETPIERAWLGAKDWLKNTPFSQWSVSRDEWETSGKRKLYSRLLLSGGGTYS